MAKATSKKTVVTEPEIEQPKEEVVIPVNIESVANITPEFEEAIKNHVPPLEPSIFDKEPLKPVSLELQNSNVKVLDAGLSMEEKIENFIATRPDGEIKMNDFLKSLYPLPSFNAPVEYLRQGSAKELRGKLIKMQSEGKITFANDSYLQLGRNYYAGDAPETKFHTILTTPIIIKK